jgi:hypothetical protein
MQSIGTRNPNGEARFILTLVLAQIMIDATGGLKTKSPSITILMTRKGPRKSQAPSKVELHDGRQKRQRYRHVAAN